MRPHGRQGAAQQVHMACSSPPAGPELPPDLQGGSLMGPPHLDAEEMEREERGERERLEKEGSG